MRSTRPCAAKIADRLRTLTDPADGLPVIDRLYVKEDLYHGDFMAEAPDLLATMRDFTYMTRKGYEFAARRGELFREPYTNETGSHRLEGILIAAGPDIAARGALPQTAIQDLAPTLLYLQDCPVPAYMDGRLITPLFAAETVQDKPPEFEDRPITGRDDKPAGWDDAMEAEIAERLKKLGYLG